MARMADDAQPLLVNGRYGGVVAGIGGHRARSEADSEPTGPPGGEHPAARRGSPGVVTRTGADADVNADDSEDEARRAAGGPGPWSHDSMEAERSLIG